MNITPSTMSALVSGCVWSGAFPIRWILPRPWCRPLFLQPIVENAFKHGICPKEEGGVVRIRVNPLREKGLLCIRVVDNGVGIQLDQLRQLRGALSQPGERWEHIGIYNVAARLRLLDRNSRFVIRSHPGRGTAVVLYLPLVENEEEFEE